MQNGMYGPKPAGSPDPIMRGIYERAAPGRGGSIPPRDPSLQPSQNMSEEELARAVSAILPQIEEALTGFGIDRQIPQIAPRLAARIIATGGAGGMPTGGLGPRHMASMGPSSRMAQRGYNAP